MNDVAYCMCTAKLVHQQLCNIYNTTSLRDQQRCLMTATHQQKQPFEQRSVQHYFPAQLLHQRSTSAESLLCCLKQNTKSITTNGTFSPENFKQSTKVHVNYKTQDELLCFVKCIKSAENN